MQAGQAGVEADHATVSLVKVARSDQMAPTAAAAAAAAALAIAEEGTAEPLVVSRVNPAMEVVALHQEGQAMVEVEVVVQLVSGPGV